MEFTQVRVGFDKICKVHGHTPPRNRRACIISTTYVKCNVILRKEKKFLDCGQSWTEFGYTAIEIV